MNQNILYMLDLDFCHYFVLEKKKTLKQIWKSFFAFKSQWIVVLEEKKVHHCESEYFVYARFGFLSLLNVQD